MFDHLTLDITHRCDSHCAYCYRIQSQETMSWQTARRALELFFNNSNSNIKIDFYGGEPLLAWPLIRKSMVYAKTLGERLARKVSFGITTNGLRLDEDKCKFMARNDVLLCLSLDGHRLAHEAARGAGSFEKVWSTYEMARRCLGRRLEINCTVAPQNARYFAEAFEFFLTKGVRRVHFAFDTENPWAEEELQELAGQLERAFDLAMRRYEDTGRLPYELFKITPLYKKPFSCEPGKDGFAVNPAGWVFSCTMLLPNHRLAVENGTLDNIWALCWGHVEQLSCCNDGHLLAGPRPFGSFSMDRYRTAERECKDCEYVLRCRVCPAIPLVFSKQAFVVPNSACRISRMKLDLEQRVYELIYKRRPEHVWDVVKGN